MTITLRPRQVYGIDGIRGRIKAGHRRVILVGPCGSGKRFQAVWLSREAVEKIKRVLIVTNRRQLVKQLYDELARFGISHGVIMGSEEQDRGQSIQVASLQTLRERHFENTGGLPPAELILADECHNDLDSYAMLFKLYPQAYVIGLTATPVGASGKSIITPDLYQSMFEGSKTSELIADGLLMPIRLFSPSEPNMEGVKSWTRPNVDKRIREVTVESDVFDAWLPWRDLKTVVFSPGVEFSGWLKHQFVKRGFPAATVDAKTSLDVRADIFEELANGSLKVLISVGVLKEGFDCPAVACGIDIQPTMQLRDFIQKTGRVRRMHADKSDAIWLDLAGAFWRHGHPDSDFPWAEVTGKESTKDIIKKKRQKGEPEPIRCPKCSSIRLSGPKCPNCGHEHKQSVRAIRMGNGTLKEVRGMAMDYGPKKITDPGEKKWNSIVFGSVSGRSGLTFRQAIAIYNKDTGQWPDASWRYVPPRGSLDLDRRIKHVVLERRAAREKAR